MIHEIKVWSEFYKDLGAERKNFEVRKDDRNYQCGDLLNLYQFNPERNERLAFIQAKITYVLRGGQFGIKKGYVVLGLDFEFAITE